jgi:hypothetical protein
MAGMDERAFCPFQTSRAVIYPDGQPGGTVTISYQQATAGFWITAATMRIYTSDEAGSG